jgi:ADP-heptose:LPS heptosyltransferase
MVLIFIPYGIGDALMAVPAIRRLASIHGAENVAVVVRGSIQSQFLRNLVSPKLRILERDRWKLFSEIALWWNIVRLRPQFVAAPMLSQRRLRLTFFSALFSRTLVPSDFMSHKFLRVKPASVCLEEFDGHQVNYFVQFFSELEPAMDRSKVSECEWRYDGTKVQVGNSETPMRVAVGLSCGVLERHKIPSPEWMATFINGLSKVEFVEVVIPASRSDETIVQRLVKNLDPKVKIDVLLDLSPEELFSKLQACALGVSGTTGQGHMMAVANIPMLVLAGVTNPHESGPYVRRALILSHCFACGPCYQKNYIKGCGRVACMETLDVEEGVRKAVKLLRDPQAGVGWLDVIKKARSKSVSVIETIHRQPISNWITKE